MRHQLITLLIIAGFVTPCIAEESRSAIGVLACTLNYKQHQKNAMMCEFRSLRSPGAQQKYVGTVDGLVLPSQGKEVLIWTVFAPPSTTASAGFLSQGYVRTRTAGHPPSWVGETNAAIVLQFETHESAELGSNIARVDLQFTGASL